MEKNLKPDKDLLLLAISDTTTFSLLFWDREKEGWSSQKKLDPMPRFEAFETIGKWNLKVVGIIVEAPDANVQNS